MNRLHCWYCKSYRWKRELESDILPWSLGGIDLGDEVLEVGPGPGLTTEWLSLRCKRLTCLEVNPALASALTCKTTQTNIHVQCGDATAMPYPDCTFSGVVALTVLHHVPSLTLQDRLFTESFRVLRPGGVFAGTDNLALLSMRLFHIGDTLVPVDPDWLRSRLEALGFIVAGVEVRKGRFRFSAKRPA